MYEEHAAEMRRCLIDCDVAAARKLWHHIAPKAPAPKTDTEALATLHYARTKCETINLRLRSYSHHWLLERGLPSGLPDPLKKKADRLYPHIADSVGIAVGSNIKEVADAIRGSMEHVVLDCYADGEKRPAIVKPRMMEMRERTKKKLYGIIGEVVRGISFR